MPFLDPLRPHPARPPRFPFQDALRMAEWAEAQDRKRRRRRGRNDFDDGGVLVEPDKPKNLSGGAAAALEFDEDSSV